MLLSDGDSRRRLHHNAALSAAWHPHIGTVHLGVLSRGSSSAYYSCDEPPHEQSWSLLVHQRQLNMTSLGEGDIQVNAMIVGKARVLNVLADSAVFPRLALAVGVTLYEGEQFSSLEMRDAEGELRLSERADALGSLQWAGARRFVRSSNYGHESEVRLVCDLDHWRLEQIERRRAGGTPVFWLEFWPILMSGGEVLDAQVAPIRFAVPRDQWLEFYAKVGGGGFEVIEVHFPGRDADRFRRAVERTRECAESHTRG